ncbi:MAG: hypothetical protein Q9207_007747, partial [Kuettlingeria erythrocarpa]
KLQCDADVTMIAYNWLRGHYMPHPNFNVQHRCRDYGAAVAWTKARAIDISSRGRSYFTRMEAGDGGRDGVVPVDFEEAPFDPEDGGNG